ncbi:MAG: hypothetical protein OEZ43_07325 [Gammaproteobacteria bacterium]|nr:hypothetical protein [Gammaproteobacteria bacterium]
MSLQRICLLLIFLLLSACGAGQKESVRLSGKAVKGILSQAVVTVFSLNTDGVRTPIGSGTTDQNGFYEIVFDEPVAEPVLVQVRSNTDTTMYCDTQLGCSNADGNRVEFGEQLQLPEAFEIQAVIPAINAGHNTANVHFFSHLASQYLQYIGREETGVVDAISVAKANAKVTDLLQQLDVIGAGDDVLHANLIDLADRQQLLQHLNGENARATLMSLLQASVARQMFRNFETNTQAATLQNPQAMFVNSMPPSASLMLGLRKPKNLSESMIFYSSEFLRNQGEIKLYAKSNNLSVQDLLEGIKEEAKALELYHADINLSDVIEVADAGLAKLNIADQASPEQILPTNTEDSLVRDYTPDVAPNDESAQTAKTSTSPEPELVLGIVDEVDSAKRLVSTVRTFGHVWNENQRYFGQVLLNGSGNEIDVNNLKSRFKTVVGQLSHTYSRIGALSAAMLNMLSSTSDVSYDIGADPENYFADDLALSGIVSITNTNQQQVIELHQGMIDGMGPVSLVLGVGVSTSCTSCNYETVPLSLLLTVEGVDKTLSVDASSAEFVIGIDAKTGARRPISLALNDAMLSASIVNTNTAETMSLDKVVMDMRLRWYTQETRLPTVDSIAVQGILETFRSGTSLQHFNGRLFYNYLGDGVTTAQTEDFAIRASFVANLLVPDAQNADYANWQQVEVKADMRQSPVLGTDRSLNIRYGNEYLSFTQFGSSGTIRIANRSGAVMLASLDRSSGELVSGSVLVRGAQVAGISNTALGPLLRYSDGSLESF